MNDLLEQLLVLTGSLKPAAGVSSEALFALRRILAAILIQQDPGRVPVPEQGDSDPAIHEAALAGAELAVERNAAGLRSHFVREAYPGEDSAAGQKSAVFGPFIDRDASVVQFGIVDAGQFLAVRASANLPFFEVHEVPMLLPRATAADAELRTFTIPAGTVWLRGERVVQGAPGYVVLRVSGGSLELGAAAQQDAPGADLQMQLDMFWRLTLTPEPAAPTTATGSDGNAVALELPVQLLVQSDGVISVTGTLGLSGFGGPLRFDTPDGGPALTDQAIIFSWSAEPQSWSIAENRSTVGQFAGTCTASLALWALPLTQVPIEHAFEAAHGGFFVTQLLGPLRLGLSGAPGQIVANDTGLTASSLGLELRVREVEAAARLDLALWGAVRSDLDLGANTRDLHFNSRRDGPDSVSLAGASLRNRWDLPRAAGGKPFGFEGAVETLQLVVEPDGLRRLACAASQAAGEAVQGLALENLYLQVLPPRGLALVGSGVSPGRLSEGSARLLFDVRHGEPMLPDPYAANGTRDDDFPISEAALSIDLAWQDGQPPAIQVQLEKNIDFAEQDGAGDESDPELRARFARHLRAQGERISLLDLSTRDHHFGIALESMSDARPRIDADNRLSIELRDVRLLMQPQVHWEPVEVVPKDLVKAETLEARSHGGRTLVGANSVKLVPLLPGIVAAEIAGAANGKEDAGALFSLPFGLRAFVRMDKVLEDAIPFLRPRPVIAFIHQPEFGLDIAAAQQLRLIATGGQRAGQPLDPARSMPGAMHQTPNATGVGGAPSINGLTSVLPDEIVGMLEFDNSVPLHAADLSGYGLSCFSNWHLAPDDAAFKVGVIQVRFDVLLGRTAYEVIEVRSVLAPCQARLVRTIVLERRNSGRVKRFDSGWVAIDDGEFKPYAPFDTGALHALRRIRQIRILDRPLLTASDGSVWQAVRFDADAQFDDVVAGGADGLVPALGQTGYVQTFPLNPPDGARFRALFDAVGGPIGGPIDCRIRLGKSLEMHFTSVLADLALDDGGGTGFAVAASGMPTLPRAGQWSAVRIDGKTSDVSPVDPSRGMPVIRPPRPAGQPRPYRFRDAADARRIKPSAEYGLLLSTPASRVLFQQPTVDPEVPNQLKSAPPLIADPMSLLKASGAFPRAAFALRAREVPEFELTQANEWRLTNPDLTFDPPSPGVASGADWELGRKFLGDRGFKLEINSGLPAQPWQMHQPPDDLEIKIAPFGTIFTIHSAFTALSDAVPGLQDPTVSFGERLKDLQDIVNALQNLINLPFKIHVNVTAGHGASPSFIVHLDMKLCIGEGPGERIDIGVGKFYGELEITGELEAALSGNSRGRLLLEFRGDVQQGILPPLLYAGGLFRFAVEVRDTGTPQIELGLGTAVSIGGDLVKGLVEVEATVKYGYMLIPETLKPGVMLGIEARAKLLAGLLGLSFSADALARIERLNDDSTVTIFADLRVAGSVQVAIFFKENVDFRTQFEQNIPLGLLELAAGVNPLVAASSLAVAVL